MHLVAIAWIYVVLMMAAAEASNSNGSLLGAFFTILLYGVLPLSMVMYLWRTPARRARRQAAAASAAAVEPDHGGHSPGDALAPKRKEP